MTTLQRLHEFFEARRTGFQDPERYERARESLRDGPRAEVMGCLEAMLRSADLQERCQALEGLALLYGVGASAKIQEFLADESPVVRWVACGCLHDYGDESATGALLERMRSDDDCQVRGVAASALGRVGAMQVLPPLCEVEKDLEVDEQGHRPADYARDAVNTWLRQWVIRQIASGGTHKFEESSPVGRVRGTVTAQGIPFDAEGRLTETERYRHIPRSALAPGCCSPLNLVTSLTPPFEVEVEFVAPAWRIARLLVLHPTDASTPGEWAIHTILDPQAIRPVSP